MDVIIKYLHDGINDDILNDKSIKLIEYYKICNYFSIDIKRHILHILCLKYQQNLFSYHHFKFSLFEKNFLKFNYNNENYCISKQESRKYCEYSVYKLVSHDKYEFFNFGHYPLKLYYHFFVSLDLDILLTFINYFNYIFARVDHFRSNEHMNYMRNINTIKIAIMIQKKIFLNFVLIHLTYLIKI